MAPEGEVPILDIACEQSPSAAALTDIARAMGRAGPIGKQCQTVLVAVGAYIEHKIDILRLISTLRIAANLLEHQKRIVDRKAAAAK